MKQGSIGGQPLAFLSSLRLAVVTMVTLGSVCGFATFYEMRNGTPAVQRDIYQTPWFAFLLALLGTNVVAVMASRYPWTKHHIGFLTAHVGILAILLGSVLSLYGGLDSNLPISEGETTGRVMLLQKALQVTAPNGARGSFPVVFEKHPPGPGHGKRFSVPGSDAVLVADDYQPHVSVQESALGRSVVPEKPPVKEERGRAAVRVHLESPAGRSEPEWVLWGEQRRLRLGDEYASVG